MKKLYFFHPALLVLLVTVLLQSCKKDDEPIHPEIQTLEITPLSASSAELKGTVVHKGKYGILDHGFIYGFNSSLDDNWSAKVSLGKDVPANTFTKQVDGLYLANSYYNNQNLYVKAYITNEKGTVYGQIVTVTLPSPNVQSIAPSSGKAGDLITITGQFFTSNKDELEITFGNIRSKVVEASNSKIVVEVPTAITNYYSSNQVPVIIKMAGRQLNVTSTFRIVPSVKDFSPKAGPVGTVITLAGDNITNYYASYSNVKVLFGQIQIPINSYNNYSIQVVVPKSITSEKITISVVIDGVTTVLPGEFLVTPPTIASISPASGLPSSSFSIFGSNFPTGSYYESNVTVKMDDIAISSAFVSSGQLTITVPSDLPKGDYKVTVTSGPHTVEAPQKYKVLAPAISGFSPTSGGIGKEVLIQGTFVPYQSYIVYFGSVSTYATSSTSSAIRATVPTGVQAGKVKLSVQYGNKMLVADDEFTVLAPSITSFLPSSGVAGTVVIITGTNFNPTAWTTVKFGTTQVNILSITETTIQAMVPSNLTPGAMKLSVVNNGQTVVSTDNFTVIN